jgi:hypothetical protein
VEEMDSHINDERQPINDAMDDEFEEVESSENHEGQYNDAMDEIEEMEDSENDEEQQIKAVNDEIERM